MYYMYNCAVFIHTQTLNVKFSVHRMMGNIWILMFPDPIDPGYCKCHVQMYCTETTSYCPVVSR
jgi:hypothetical protein